MRSGTKPKPLSQHKLLSLLDIIHRSIAVQTSRDLTELVADVAQVVPVGGIAVLGGRIDASGSVSSVPHIVQYGPSGWLSEYCTTLGFSGASDPLCKFLNSSFVQHSLLNNTSSISRYDRVHGVVIARDAGRLSFRSTLVFVSFHAIDRLQMGPSIHYLAPHLHSALLRTTFQSAVSNVLSERQKEVLRWVGRGKSSLEISEILQISERTVVFHVQNAMKKLGVSKRSHAVAQAVANGFIPTT